MSDKTPHWPGADGKPGVSFAPKTSSGGDAKAKGDAPAADSTAPIPAVKGDGKPQGQPQAKIVRPANSPVIQKPAQGQQPTGQGTKPTAATSRPESGQGGKPGAQPVGQGAQVAPAAKQGPAAVAAGASAATAASKPAKSGGVWGTQSKPAKADAGDTGIGKVGGVRRTRKARLRLSRIDPWSVMKTSFLFSIAFGIMLVVIVAVLWSVVVGSGALDAVNSTMTQLIGDEENKFSIEAYINGGRVIGLAAVLAAVDVVIMTAVATLFAFLYNLAAAVIGGLEVTLAED
ncbi:MAG: DUF3566 domain-containing protein [Propionibacteriaceae bacterium]|nr:DUF3566 domain-containing protein [Propionibacteriaceae bacterium]